ncbi:hypothetical protein L1987_02079 [Smallanthus sonchifolius]|uniref:Uncharacterized protein n=1 Tax=Smallanthus sonchifolius TaxID=185202 RepID=A0ACB9K720_9ASTR|nr:hypothetical protein L1987_02079 [Smallanthus sonchifolius]
MVMSSGLIQQSSKRVMTFAELQNTLGGSGKDFGSMNMDELLNSDLGVANNLNLQKQGSLTLPRILSQKTVDEVWKELVKEPNLQPQEKQPALGEMTLEEFLRKAGVVPEKGQTFGVNNHPDQIKGFHQQAKQQKILPKQAAFNFTSSMNLMKKAQMGSHVNGVSIYGKIGNQVNLVNEPQFGSVVNGVSIIGKSDHPTKSNLDTSPSPPSYAYGEDGFCGRNIGGSLEKGVERRRKRMIKNRESAARSRARKQAYTLELEAEVAKLKKLNQELQKKQEEIMESHNFQVPVKMKLGGNRKSCLRRTVTGPW